MTPFRERNPAVVGAIGLAVLAVLVFAAFNAADLPVIGGGRDFRAAFSDASGLQPGNEVRVAGVKVGKVREVSLEGGHVRVGFRITDDAIALGDATSATIRIKTVLGQKYLAIVPAGAGRLHGEIPLSRTASPFDVVQAVSGLSQTVDRVDTTRLATAFATIADTFKDSPEAVKASLRGLSRLSTTIARRDGQLAALLARTKGVTAVLADRDTEFVRLIADGDLLLAEISKRRDAIHAILVSTTQLSDQLIGLVADNRAQLQPALHQLRAVVSVLEKNEASIDASVAALAPFVRAFSNVLGNGRWFDTYVQCLMPPPVAVAGTPVTTCHPGSTS